MSDKLELIAYNLIEITMSEELSPMEILTLEALAEVNEINITINASGRMIRAEVEDVADITNLLAEINVVEDIGLIKIITELEPQWDREVV